MRDDPEFRAPAGRCWLPASDHRSTNHLLMLKLLFQAGLASGLLLPLASCQGQAQRYNRTAFEREVAAFRFSLYPYLTPLSRTNLQTLARTDLVLAPTLRTRVETFLISHQASITQYQTEILGAATVPSLPLAEYTLWREMPADSGLTAELTGQPLVLRLNGINPFVPLYTFLPTAAADFFERDSDRGIGQFFEMQHFAAALPYAVRHSADAYTLALDYHTLLVTAEFDRRTQRYQHFRVYRAKPRKPPVVVHPPVEALGRALVEALVRADPRPLRPFQATAADTRQLLLQFREPAPDSTVRRETANFARESDAALAEFRQANAGIDWATLRFEQAVLKSDSSVLEAAGLGPDEGQVTVTCRAGTGPSITLDLGKCFYLNGHWVAPLQGLRRR